MDVTHEGCEGALSLTTTIKRELSIKILQIIGEQAHLDFVFNYLGSEVAESG